MSTTNLLSNMFDSADSAIFSPVPKLNVNINNRTARQNFNNNPFDKLYAAQILEITKNPAKLLVQLQRSEQLQIPITHPFVSLNGWIRTVPEQGSFVLLAFRGESTQDPRILGYFNDEDIAYAFANKEIREKTKKAISENKFLTKVSEVPKAPINEYDYNPYRLLEETEQEGRTKGSTWYFSRRGRARISGGALNIAINRDDLEINMRSPATRTEYVDNYPSSMEDCEISGIQSRPDKEKPNAWRKYFQTKEKFNKEYYRHLKFKGWPHNLAMYHEGHVRDLQGELIKHQVTKDDLRCVSYWWTDYVEDPKDRPTDKKWTIECKRENYKDPDIKEGSAEEWREGEKPDPFWKRVDEDAIPKSEKGGGRFGWEYDKYGNAFFFLPAHTKHTDKEKHGYRIDIPTGNYFRNVAHPYFKEWQLGGNSTTNIAQDEKTWIGKNEIRRTDCNRSTYVGLSYKKDVVVIEDKFVGEKKPEYCPAKPNITEATCSGSNASCNQSNNCCDAGKCSNPTPTTNDYKSCCGNSMSDATKGACSGQNTTNIQKAMGCNMSNSLSSCSGGALQNMNGNSLCNQLNSNIKGNSVQDVAKSLGNQAKAANQSIDIDKLSKELETLTKSVNEQEMLDFAKNGARQDVLKSALPAADKEQLLNKLSSCGNINDVKSACGNVSNIDKLMGSCKTSSCGDIVKGLNTKNCSGLSNNQCQSLASSCGNKSACCSSSACQQAACDKSSCTNGSCPGKQQQDQNNKDCKSSIEEKKCCGKQEQKIEKHWKLSCPNIEFEAETFKMVCFDSIKLQAGRIDLN